MGPRLSQAAQGPPCGGGRAHRHDAFGRCRCVDPVCRSRRGLCARGDSARRCAAQRIRPALDRLGDELGIEHVLASRKLYTDGAEVLYDYAEHAGDIPEARSARELVVVRNDQRVFNEIIDSYLTRIDFSDDQWARVIHLPKYGPTDVVVNQQRGFGAPIFANGGVRLETVLAAFKRGLGIDELTTEYGVPEADLLNVLRVHTQAT
jgi:uncharacterized protein (DUF433 family)